MGGLQLASERVVGIWAIQPHPTMGNAGKVAVMYGMEFVCPILSLSG